MGRFDKQSRDVMRSRNAGDRHRQETPVANADAVRRVQKKLLSPRDPESFAQAFAPNKLLPAPIPLNERAINVAAMGVITVGIARFFPKLVRKRHLEIIVAGASAMELSGAVWGMDAMHHWLQVEEIACQFCAPEIHASRQSLSTNPAMAWMLAKFDIVNGMLANLMWKRRADRLPAPNLITVLHPGLEYSRECWLKDEGLREAAEGGIPILLSAFAEREMHADRMALEARGYQLSDPFHNLGAPAGTPEEASDPDPRFGAWLYAITGVDANRWQNPDTKRVAQALDRGKSPERLFDHHPQREQIVGMLNAGHRGGTAYARMEDGVRLKNVSLETNHPLFFTRFQLQSVLLGKPDPNDYHAGLMLRYGAGLGGVDFVMPYITANPGAMEARDQEGRTLVFHAIKDGDKTGAANTDLLEKVIDRADLAVIDDHALTPLQVAVQRNNWRAVELLLNAGAPITSQPGARDMIDFLIDQRAWRLLERLVQQEPATAAQATANPVLIPRLQNAGAPAPIVEQFRAWERAQGDTRSTTKPIPKNQNSQRKDLGFPADAAVKLMLFSHSLLQWTGSLGLGEPLNVMEIELAAELGDHELHRSIRTAEKTGGKLYEVVMALYGATAQLIANLMIRDQTKSIQKEARNWLKGIRDVIIDNGISLDNGFAVRACEAHTKGHAARYSAEFPITPDRSTPEKKRHSLRASARSKSNGKSAENPRP